MELPIVEEAYEEFEEIRKSGIINMAARRSVQEIAINWFGPVCALTLLTAEDYYKLLRTYDDWRAQKEIR